MSTLAYRTAAWSTIGYHSSSCYSCSLLSL